MTGQNLNAKVRKANVGQLFICISYNESLMMLAQPIKNCYLKLRQFFASLLFLIMLSPCMAFLVRHNDEAAEAYSKAMFIYNFAKYIHWPEDEQYDIFTIGVIGKTQTINELEKICVDKTVKGKAIKIIYINETEKVDDCQAIFITRRQSFLLEDVLDVLDGKGTLVITEMKGMLKEGSAINFIKSGNKDSFEVNKNVLEKQGLKIPDNLLVLALNVDAGPRF